MPVRHEVKQGEGLSSISLRYGFAPATIWNHPDNQKLKIDRPDPNILLPGDTVVLPDKRVEAKSCDTDRRHIFKRVEVPARFRLQLLDSGNPRSGLQYQAEVSGRVLTGVTDQHGMLDIYVPPDASRGVIRLGDRLEEILEVRFGYLDPLSTLLGVEHRLTNLGFDCGGATGEMNERTGEALRDFQRRVGLPVTGEADDATLSKLQDLHDRTEDFPSQEK